MKIHFQHQLTALKAKGKRLLLSEKIDRHSRQEANNFMWSDGEDSPTKMAGQRQMRILETNSLSESAQIRKSSEPIQVQKQVKKTHEE